MCEYGCTVANPKIVATYTRCHSFKVEYFVFYLYKTSQLRCICNVSHIRIYRFIYFYVAKELKEIFDFVYKMPHYGTFQIHAFSYLWQLLFSLSGGALCLILQCCLINFNIIVDTSINIFK